MLDFARFNIDVDDTAAFHLLRQLKGLIADPAPASRQSSALWLLLQAARPRLGAWIADDLWKAAGQVRPDYRARWLTAMTMMVEGLLARHGLLAVGDVERAQAAARARGGMEPEQAAELVRLLRAIVADNTPGSKHCPDLWELLEAAKPYCAHYPELAWRFAGLDDWNHRRRALKPQVDGIDACLHHAGLVLGRGA